MTMMPNRKPKIAYVMTPITFGGVERVNLNFLKYVDRDQFNIEPIIFLRPWDTEILFETELKRLGYQYFSIPVAKCKHFDIFRVVRCLRLLKKQIDNLSCDLIHTHGYLADLLGFVASRVCKIPIVSTCHGFIFEGKKLTLYNNLDILALRYFNRVFSVSEPLKLDLLTRGINNDTLTVIENAPELSQCSNDISKLRNKLRKEWGVEPNEILIGYIGRLSAEKGLTHLIESMKLLDSNAKLIKLVVIGEGSLKTELKEQVHNYNLSSNIVFTGFQKNIDEWFEAIDILVLPSLTEGTPMVLLEAMTHGVPCIATTVGGIPNIINSGVDGILVCPGKPEEISDAINELCNDSVKRSYISSNAKIKIENKYNIKNWVKKIESEYLRILHKA